MEYLSVKLDLYVLDPTADHSTDIKTLVLEKSAFVKIDLEGVYPQAPFYYSDGQRLRIGTFAEISNGLFTLVSDKPAIDPREWLYE